MSDAPRAVPPTWGQQCWWSSQQVALTIGQHPHWRHMSKMVVRQQQVVEGGHSEVSSHVMGTGPGSGPGAGEGPGVGPGSGPGSGGLGPVLVGNEAAMAMPHRPSLASTKALSLM